MRCSSRASATATRRGAIRAWRRRSSKLGARPSCRGRARAFGSERIATKRAVPDSSGAAAPLTFHKTPAERARAERALRKAHKPKKAPKKPAYAPPPPPPSQPPKKQERRPWGAPPPPGERDRPKLEARIAKLEREKSDVTATLKRIEALLGGAGEPPRRRSAARRSLSPAKRGPPVRKKGRRRTCRRRRRRAGPPRLLRRAFRTSEHSLAWPGDGIVSVP